MGIGLFLGFMTWISTMMLWKGLPRWVKMLTLRYPIPADLLVGVLTYYSVGIFSQSIACMVATSTAPFMMQASLAAIDKWGRPYLGLEEAKPKVKSRFRTKK